MEEVPATRRLIFKFGDSFHTLSNRNFRLLALGNFLYMGGFNMDMVARGWLVYRLSGSGLAVGEVALGYGMAQTATCLFAGAVADRADKRKLLAATHLALSAISVATALLIQLQLIQLWQVFIQSVLFGAVFPFSMPARQAYIPELVDKGDVANAVAIDANVKNLSRVLCPAIEGLLLGWNPTFAFYAIAALQVSSALTVLRLPPSPPKSSGSGGMLSEIVAGFSYVWREPRVRMLMAMALAVTLLGWPYQNLLPVFQISVLHVSEARLGVMYAATGAGALVGSFVVTFISRRGRLELVQALAGVGLGVMVALFAISSDFALSVFLLFFVGAASFGYVALNNMLVLVNTRPELYGRVTSLYVLSYGLMPLALVPLGASIDLAGAPITMAAAGLLLVVAMVVLMLVFPENLRKRVTT